MKERSFVKQFSTRQQYLNKPFSRDEYDNILRLCKEEKARANKIGIIASLLFLTPFIFLDIIGLYMAVFLLHLVMVVVIILSFSSDFVKVTIEEVVFKSSDPLGKYKNESHNRFLPSAITHNTNIYDPSTIHFEFVEKVRIMRRPLMRFEVDILNSL